MSNAHQTADSPHRRHRRIIRLFTRTTKATHLSRSSGICSFKHSSCVFNPPRIKSVPSNQKLVVICVWHMRPLSVWNDWWARYRCFFCTPDMIPSPAEDTGTHTQDSLSPHLFTQAFKKCVFYTFFPSTRGSIFTGCDRCRLMKIIVQFWDVSPYRWHWAGTMAVLFHINRCKYTSLAPASNNLSIT